MPEVFNLILTKRQLNLTCHCLSIEIMQRAAELSELEDLHKFLDDRLQQIKNRAENQTDVVKEAPSVL